MGPDAQSVNTRIVTDRQISLPQGSVIAIGAFDGVHQGHQALISDALVQARQLGLPSVVWTFDPPPKVVFGRAAQLIPLGQKLARIARLGPDYIVVASFTRCYASRSAEEFLADLGRLAPRSIHVGGDFRFGVRQSGDVCLLARRFDVSIRQPVTCAAGETISSSRIRQLRETGNFCDADRLLAAPCAMGQLGGSLFMNDIRFREGSDVWI